MTDKILGNFWVYPPHRHLSDQPLSNSVGRILLPQYGVYINLLKSLVKLMVLRLLRLALRL
jgi:hypothetical protein